MLSNEGYKYVLTRDDLEIRQTFCNNIFRERGAVYANSIARICYVEDRFVPDGVLASLVPRLHPTYMTTSGGFWSRFTIRTRATITVFPEAFDPRHHVNLDDFVVSLVGYEGWYAQSFFDDPELVTNFSWEAENKKRNRKLRAAVFATRNQRAYLTTKNSPSYAHKVQQNLTRLEVALLHSCSLSGDRF